MYEYLHRVDILTPKLIDKETMLLFDMFLYYLWRGGIAEYEDDEEYLPSGCVRLHRAGCGRNELRSARYPDLRHGCGVLCAWARMAAVPKALAGPVL
jgi:hypothetical protein